jgi:hypothetical protein
MNKGILVYNKGYYNTVHSTNCLPFTHTHYLVLAHTHAGSVHAICIPFLHLSHTHTCIILNLFLFCASMSRRFLSKHSM